MKPATENRNDKKGFISEKTSSNKKFLPPKGQKAYDRAAKIYQEHLGLMESLKDK